MLTRRLHRPATISRGLRQVRFNSSTPSPPPTRHEMTSTTFSSKSAPRNVHERPEQIRGFPPNNSGPKWKKNEAKPEATESTEQAFDGPSRPRLIYARQPRRDLPVIKNQLPISAWGGFLLYATNAERLASSVTRSLQFHLRNSEVVAAALGKKVKLEEPWYILGDPWISGNINTMQGRVDLKFRVKGSKGELVPNIGLTVDAGVVYFTAIRPSQADPWRIGELETAPRDHTLTPVRYKLNTDSGESLRLENTIEKI